jgi:hypothetical protein
VPSASSERTFSRQVGPSRKVSPALRMFLTRGIAAFDSQQVKAFVGIVIPSLSSHQKAGGLGRVPVIPGVRKSGSSRKIVKNNHSAAAILTSGAHPLGSRTGHNPAPFRRPK